MKALEKDADIPTKARNILILLNEVERQLHAIRKWADRLVRAEDGEPK